MMHWKFLIGVALAAQEVHALLRFACSQLVIERFDPLLNPNQVSPHLHQIVGGDAFNVTMDPENDLPGLSKCTTCSFSEDFSNYWTAVLYFQHANGSFKRVPQLPGQYLGNVNGGMTVYYVQPDGGKKVTAFKKGFRMIVGDAMTRSMNSSSPEATSLNFRCLDANGGNGGVTGKPGSDSNQLPDHPCAGGIRSQIVFPSCWDGVNIDSANHKSHVTYPVKNACPSTHPVQVPSLFIETVWDTTQFNKLWPSGAQQPFVYSMGDPAGVAQHADYMFGWKGDSLQRAMDSCTSFGGSCSTLKTQSVDAINKCTQKSRVSESYEGWLTALPGCNPIQAGPGRAVPNSGCGAPTTWIGSDPGPTKAAYVGAPAETAAPAIITPVVEAMQPQFSQCGGSGYNGPTKCQTPYTCKYSNEWYSQCA